MSKILHNNDATGTANNAKAIAISRAFSENSQGDNSHVMSYESGSSNISSNDLPLSFVTDLAVSVAFFFSFFFSFGFDRAVVSANISSTK